MEMGFLDLLPAISHVRYDTDADRMTLGKRK
jgi:hypothetical protein